MKLYIHTCRLVTFLLVSMYIASTLYYHDSNIIVLSLSTFLDFYCINDGLYFLITRWNDKSNLFINSLMTSSIKVQLIKNRM